MNKKLKVGVIGLGIGEKHLEVYSKHPKCEVIKLCDFSEIKLKEIKKKYPNIKCHKNADDILLDSDIDIVSIASYDNFHYEQICKAIQNDKHVYVEKPMCLFFEEAKRIKEYLNKKTKICLSANMVLRTCPRFIEIKKKIISGSMGEIYFIQGDYLWGRIHKLISGWRKDMDYYSIINGAAVHMIDLIIWLVEELPVEVKGYGNKITTIKSELRFKDFSSFLLKFESGKIVQISAHGGCIHPHFHNLNVYGTKMTLINNILGGKSITFSNSKLSLDGIEGNYPEKNKRGEVLESFIDSITNKRNKAIVSKTDVFNTMSICFAAEKAVNNNANVNIEYL